MILELTNYHLQNLIHFCDNITVNNNIMKICQKSFEINWSAKKKLPQLSNFIFQKLKVNRANSNKTSAEWSLCKY